ncbi:SsrA-binding protein [candidate division TM7 genomosp. GTL1]|nr:SsrA-binding protein [candidate division TM7 genomosp. GTL1]
MKKKTTTSGAVLNRRAKFDYELGDELAVGLVLNGPEVRAARDGHVQLKGAYVTIRNDELWLNNASFSVKPAQPKRGDARAVDTQPRKLLAHRKQIATLAEQKKTGLTIVPLKLFTSGRHIKLLIAAGKGKKKYDKRETLKRRAQEREAQRAMRR